MMSRKITTQRFFRRNFFKVSVTAAILGLTFVLWKVNSPSTNRDINPTPNVRRKAHIALKDLEVSRFPGSYRFWRPWSSMRGILPADVASDGRSYVLSGRKLRVFLPDGNLDRVSICSWTTLGQMIDGYVRHSDGSNCWAARSIGSVPSLVKFSIDGRALLNIPGQDFMQVGGLYCSEDGDVFVLAHDYSMRRFDSRGKFLRRYDLLVSNDGLAGGPYFSAFAAYDGSVYSIPATWIKITPQGRQIEGLQLNQWNPQGRRTARKIKLSHFFGELYNDDLALCGADASGNLYVQYTTKTSEAEGWAGPGAIARIGLDNTIVKIFDVHSHYKQEIEQAKRQATQARKKLGVIGVGEVIHVSKDGSIYLEVADATHYRIDKISLTETPTSPQR